MHSGVPTARKADRPRRVDLVTRDFEKWRAHFPVIRTGGSWVGADLDSEFEGRVSRREVGDLSVNVMSVRARAHAIERTELQVRSNPESFLLAAVQLSGSSRLTTGRTVATLRPGDHVVCGWHATSQWLFVGDFSLFVVRLPRALLDFAIGDADAPLGEVLSSQTGAGPLLMSLVQGISTDLDVLESRGGARVARSLVELFGASMLDRSAPARPGPDDAFIRATAVMEDWIGDPRLTVGDIARRLFLSPRQVQAAFAGRGTTVTAWLRTRRLAGAREALMDPQEAASVAQIAQRWGFANASHFARAFREAYGCAPSRMRTGGGGPVSH